MAIFVTQISHADNLPAPISEQTPMNIDLTPAEQKTLQQDAILMQTVAQFNTTNHTQNVSIMDIFPDAVAIPEMLYWVNGNDLSRANLKSLLNAGTDINQGYDYFGKKGYTALHVASEEGYLETVKFLIENRANPAVTLDTPQHETPLDLARRNHHQGVVDYLQKILLIQNHNRNKI